EITLVDRQNYHLFQPLAYQVATGSLSASEIASPLRAVFKRQKNVRVVLAEAVGVDLAAHTLELGSLPNGDERDVLSYDTLAVATGSRYSYFGHDDWREYAPELKSLPGALDIRARILRAFEAAEVETDPAKRAAWLTFVVVGAGPTGVEMAGQIAELARDALPRDFRNADTQQTRVLLVETADRVLGAFVPKLSARAFHSLQTLGVTPLVGHTVVDITANSVSVQNGAGDVEEIPARTAIWAAGVTTTSFARVLADAAGAETDRAGRITVQPDLRLAGHPDVFALGDMVRVGDKVFPGVAPVAMQQGRYVARVIVGDKTRPFKYKDKGNLATIGRSRAVAEVGPIRASGFPAWALWLGVHLVYLIGFQNRLLVLLRWLFSFATHGRGARLITPR
ncbi:MAG TPA: NAD(P)/FAD-dependent oxidoreductase, partial [Casimicrobiaceae bacterium]|nr:NAD(P)/FAD-dependent oxidoreductase [Casimicrobiaceae bacterium]